MYLLCPVWNLVGPCDFLRWNLGQPEKYCDHCQPTTIYYSESTERNIGTYKIVLKIYQRICGGDCSNGEVIGEVIESHK